MSKKAIVLGGTVPHVELIKQLQQRGFYVILIDYLSDSPARLVADEHIKESTLDEELVAKIAVERNVDLVIAGAIDQANLTAVYAMQKIGKVPPYDYEKAMNATNKGLMKRIMMENNILTSRFVYVNSKEEIPSIELTYPVMVKPADSNSANGVKMALNKDEMMLYLDDAISISRNGRAIVEEFVEGREISAYCFIQDGKAHLLQTAERLSILDGEKKIIKCYSSVAPAQISKKAEQNAEDTATQIAQAFGFDNTPLFFQGIVKGDDIYVIEFAPRVGGGVSFQTILSNTGFDIISGVIDSYLGIRTLLNNHAPESILTVNTFYGNDGIYDHTSDYESLIEDHTIEHIFFHKKAGSVIDNSRASSSRVGAFITKASSMEETFDKVNRAFNVFHVFNDKGEDMLRKDISISKIIGNK